MNMRFGTWKVRSLYRAGLFRTMAEEISESKLDVVEYRRSDEIVVALNQEAIIHFSLERGMRIMNYGQVFSCIRQSCLQLRG
jgi:hypothetical protein